MIAVKHNSLCVILCVLLTFLFSSEIASQCTVNAGSDVSICSGETVQLGGSPTVSGNTGAVSYSWTNGAAGTANPSVSPTTTTTYILTVSGGGCQQNAMDTVKVSVLASPQASFTFGPDNACAGTPVNFVSSVSGCSGCTYQWNFGDPSSGVSNTSTSANPTHTFQPIGSGTETFTVSLTVTAANGCSTTVPQTVTVKKRPNAVLNEDSQFTQCLGLSSFYAYVQNASAPASNSNYYIDWGDGTAAYNSSSPPSAYEHIYSGINIWTLSYTVTGTNGCTNTTQYEVTNISNPAIGAATSGNTLQCGPVDICFELSNYLNNFSEIMYDVDFGDGTAIETYSQSTLPNPVCHEYSASSCPGAFTFSITAVSNCLTPTVAQITPIQIFTGPQALFNAPANSCVNSAVHFNNETIPGYNQGCSSVTTYLWDFGDPASGSNNTSTAQHPNHTYSTAGTYTVTLTALNGGNPQLACGSTTFQAEICVENPPSPSVSVNHSSGCVPLTISTINNSTSASTCSVSTNWEISYSELPCLPNGGAYSFMGGSSPSSNTPVIQLESEGIYTISYRMENSCGTFTDSETVTVNAAPMVQVSTSSNGVCAGTSGTPTAVVNECSLPATYQWTFTGGTPASASTLIAPAVSYANAGNYNVSLAVTNACGTTTQTAVMQVLNIPEVEISVTNDDTAICSGQSTVLTATGAASYTWSPSTYLSNYSSSGNTVTATLTSGITYTVTGTSGSCSDTGTITLTVDPLPVVTAGGTFSLCEQETLGISVNQPTGNGPYTYNWSPGTNLSNTQIHNPVFSGTQSQNYTVTITDGNGCQGSTTVPVTVNPLPQTNAGPDITLCSQPVATQLTGYSPTTGGTGVWSGTGVTSTGVFTPSGNGAVTLQYCFENTATGCSACDEMIITVTDPTAANGGPDSTFCLNTGTYQLPAGAWSGSSSVSTSGLFTPSQAGIHNLTVLQGSGSCQTTDNVVITVLALPVANAGADVSICEGETVNLTGTCTNCPNGPIDVCSWSGGTLSSPINCSTTATPQQTTTYTLIIVDEAGCTNNTQVTVFVNSHPNISAGGNQVLCNQAIPVQLTPTPAGGIWSGGGITPSGEFTPSATGSFEISYCLSDSQTGCGSCDTIEIVVNDPVMAISGPDVTLCENEGVYQLTGFSPSTGGSWSGDGVINSTLGTIHAATAGSGTHTLTFSTGTGTCLTSDTMELTINPTPDVDAGPGAAMCGNAAVFNLSGFSPLTGGVWEGQGITNSALGTFDPALGSENNVLLFWYEDPVSGCRDSSQTSVTVDAVPIANFVLNNQGCTSASIDYSNTSSGGNSYTWNFGNGDVLTGFEPDYTFSQSGIYQITQIVENIAGCKDTAYNTTEIIHPPIAAIDLTTWEGCAPLYVPFDNQSSGEYMSFEWDLGNGTQSNDSIPDGVTYEQGPDVLIYPISLTVSNYCGSDTDEAEITVLPVPQASFGTNLDAFCSPFPVLFNNTSVGLPDTFLWDFGDGTFSNEEEPVSHAYYTDTTNSDYTIWLYLENECGADTASYTITVWPNTVTAFFNTSVLEGCEPLTVQFTDHSDGGTQTSYNLGGNFGITSDDNPTWTYPVGEYTISQFVDNGCSYDTMSVTITVYSSPNIDFTTNVSSSCIGDNIQFIPQPGNAIELFWNFGDGNVSGVSNAEHAYDTGGTYTVSLLGLSDNGCVATVEHPIEIYTGPEASFTAPQDIGCSPFELCFVNTTSGGNFYQWQFGDGSASNAQSPCHTFVYNGEEALPLTVTMVAQDIHLCADTTRLEILVSPQPVSAFTLSDFDPCTLPQTLVTTNLSEFANGYLWSVNNEPVSTFLNTSFTFIEDGNYQISLLASNQFGCSSTSTTDYVINPLPQAMLSSNPRQGCMPLTVQFNNQSSNAYDYLWDLGNGVQSNDFSPLFTYNYPGTYDVNLIAYSQDGCTDTLFADDFIRVFPLPTADFWMEPEETDIYQSTIDFYNTSNGAYNVKWYFGDGAWSNEYDVSYTYPDAGFWPVTLTVWNIYGCAAEKKDVVLINDIFNLFVPNAFTPDDDGINEVFLPQISGKPFIHRYTFRIFDRWGTMIFETNDYEEPWKGNVREGDFFAQNEIYNWQIIIQLKGSEEERLYQGHVSVIR